MHTVPDKVYAKTVKEQEAGHTVQASAQQGWVTKGQHRVNCLYHLGLTVQ